MSHPQKTCRVLSPSARVGLRPFGAIMPCCALLVAGEPPQQGVNCALTPGLTPSSRKRSASHISSNPSLRRRLRNWPRSRPRPHDGSNSPWQPLFQQSPQPSPAPPPAPVAVIPAPTWPPPALPLLSQPFPPPPLPLPARPIFAPAPTPPNPSTQPRNECLLVQWHGKGDAREIKRRGARTRARRPANRRRTAVPPVLPSAVFGHGPAHRVALLHARGVHLPRPRLRPGVARRLRQRHALGRRGDVRGARAARLAHRSPEPPRENERLLRRPDRPRYDDGGPRPHPRRRPYGCGVRRRHGDGHRRSVPLLPLGRGVQPDGRHADAHVRCSVLHRGGGRIVRRQHDATAVRHPRHRASAPRLACVRTAELPAPARRATPANGRAPPAPLEAARHHGRSGAAVGHGRLAHTGSRVDGSGASRRGDRSGRHRRHRHGPHA